MEKQNSLVVRSTFEVKEQVNQIQHLMKNVMKVDEHFGTITGCKKPSLWKSGAEKILFTFRLSQTYEEVSVIEKDDLISYRIKCIIKDQDGNYINSGHGACNSRERKYATRSISLNQATEEEKANALREEERSFFKNGSRQTFKVIIIRQDPWELQNTIYKMACKRALIAATLNSTAASDIFTQDLEDGFAPSSQVEKHEAKEPEKIPTPDLTEKQLKRLFAIAKKANWSHEEVKGTIKASFEIESTKDLTKAQYDQLCDFITNNSRETDVKP